MGLFGFKSTLAAGEMLYPFQESGLCTSIWYRPRCQPAPWSWPRHAS